MNKNIKLSLFACAILCAHSLADSVCFTDGKWDPTGVSCALGTITDHNQSESDEKNFVAGIKYTKDGEDLTMAFKPDDITTAMVMVKEAGTGAEPTIKFVKKQVLNFDLTGNRQDIANRLVYKYDRSMKKIGKEGAPINIKLDTGKASEIVLEHVVWNKATEGLGDNCKIGDASCDKLHYGIELVPYPTMLKKYGHLTPEDFQISDEIKDQVRNSYFAFGDSLQKIIQTSEYPKEKPLTLEVIPATIRSILANDFKNPIEPGGINDSNSDSIYLSDELINKLEHPLEDTGSGLWKPLSTDELKQIIKVLKSEEYEIAVNEKAKRIMQSNANAGVDADTAKQKATDLRNKTVIDIKESQINTNLYSKDEPDVDNNGFTYIKLQGSTIDGFINAPSLLLDTRKSQDKANANKDDEQMLPHITGDVDVSNFGTFSCHEGKCDRNGGFGGIVVDGKTTLHNKLLHYSKDTRVESLVNLDIQEDKSEPNSKTTINGKEMQKFVTAHFKNGFELKHGDLTLGPNATIENGLTVPEATTDVLINGSTLKGGDINITAEEGSNANLVIVSKNISDKKDSENKKDSERSDDGFFAGNPGTLYKPASVDVDNITTTNLGLVVNTNANLSDSKTTPTVIKSKEIKTPYINISNADIEGAKISVNTPDQLRANEFLDKPIIASGKVNFKDIKMNVEDNKEPIIFVGYSDADVDDAFIPKDGLDIDYQNNNVNFIGGEISNAPIVKNDEDAVSKVDFQGSKLSNLDIGKDTDNIKNAKLDNVSFEGVEFNGANNEINSKDFSSKALMGDNGKQKSQITAASIKADENLRFEDSTVNNANIALADTNKPMQIGGEVSFVGADMSEIGKNEISFDKNTKAEFDASKFNDKLAFKPTEASGDESKFTFKNYGEDLKDELKKLQLNPNGEVIVPNLAFENSHYERPSDMGELAAKSIELSNSTIKVDDKFASSTDKKEGTPMIKADKLVADNSEIYGGFTGDNLTLSGSKIHGKVKVKDLTANKSDFYLYGKNNETDINNSFVGPIEAETASGAGNTIHLDAASLEAVKKSESKVPLAKVSKNDKDVTRPLFAVKIDSSLGSYEVDDKEDIKKLAFAHMIAYSR